MKKYAKIGDNDELIYPDASEFVGIPNWERNDSLLRKHGYLPINGECPPMAGYSGRPETWHVELESSTRIEPRQFVTEDGYCVMQDTEVVVDMSHIQIDTWFYREIKAVEPQRQDETEFKAACKLFRDVCSQIGEFIGDENFRGGFDDYAKFINSPAAKQSKASASLLASMWNGANEYAKYEGLKLGYGQPQWWYKCWEYTDEELEANESIVE